MVICRRVFAVPQSRFHGGIVGGFQSSIKRRIDIHESSQMDIVSKLVNENAFFLIGIAQISE